MLDRLAEIETKYEDLAEQINDPDVIANQTEWRKRMKEYSDMTPIVEKYREYKQAKEGIAESLAMLEEKQEEDFRELCRQAQQQDTYRVQALLAGYEKDKDSAAAVLWQATQAASAALRRPGFDGVQPDTAARILRAAEAARRGMKANGNLRLARTVCGMEMAAR